MKKKMYRYVLFSSATSPQTGLLNNKYYFID